MLGKIITAAAVAVLSTLLTPMKLDAYGACHVGYTHVGPNGVYHTGETAVRGPSGTYEAGRTTAVGAGGGAYHAGYGGYEKVNPYGGASGGYHYSAVHADGAAYGGVHYGYIR